MKSPRPALDRLREVSLYEAFRRSNDVMFYCDRDSGILDVNPAFVRLFGFKREEAVGKNPRFLRSAHSTAELYGRMWESILDPSQGYWRGEIVDKAKDGREITLLLSITAVRDTDEGVLGFMAIGMDLTEQVSLKTRVAQSEALANIGEMAAVVAHEIRNPLGSIVLASNQLANEALSPSDRGTVMKLLRSESKRLSDVLASFLTYARPPSIRLSRADLNALVAEVCGILQSDREMMRHARMSVSLAPDLAPCPMDPEQIRQVVWNILVNALQAMEGYGRLTVSTGREPGHVFLRVRDTGPGIQPAVLPQIFKPFFTTKQQGTGLGLATADRIMKAHAGAIEVESKPGEGATFTVRLPRPEE
ncbi:MAG: PAS domain S-box protein [Elusimicrobia bacterium]|nr:PAS domain S-box protein [Elusimicrobiota bacterium]